MTDESYSAERRANEEALRKLNAHDALVAALTKLTNLSRHPLFAAQTDLTAWDGAIEDARAALAAAKGA